MLNTNPIIASHYRWSSRAEKSFWIYLFARRSAAMWNKNASDPHEMTQLPRRVFSAVSHAPLDFSYMGGVAGYGVAAEPMSSIYNLNHRPGFCASARLIGALDKERVRDNCCRKLSEPGAHFGGIRNASNGGQNVALPGRLWRLSFQNSAKSPQECNFSFRLRYLQVRTGSHPPYSWSRCYTNRFLLFSNGLKGIAYSLEPFQFLGGR
jgi:hypothetical protein